MVVEEIIAFSQKISEYSKQNLDIQFSQFKMKVEASQLTEKHRKERKETEKVSEEGHSKEKGKKKTLTCVQCPWPSQRSGSTRLQGSQSSPS